MVLLPVICTVHFLFGPFKLWNLYFASVRENNQCCSSLTLQLFSLGLLQEVKVKLAGEGRTTSDGGNDGEDEVDYAAAGGGSDGEVQDCEEMDKVWIETTL